MEEFDAIVIGTGQAGKPLAGALGQAGVRTAIIEKGRVGGTCVIDGCTPTKTMVASARVAHLARRGGDYGVRTGTVEVDLARVRERKRDMVDAWSEGGRKGLEGIDAVELIFGTARFTGDHRVEVELNDGGTRRLTAPKIFINTGTRTRVPPVEGLDGVPWLDNAGIMELGAVPEHLLILGGGFIGAEFAQMFRRFGAKVTVLEGKDRLVDREDEDVSEALREIFEEDGIQVLTGTTATRVEEAGTGIRVHYQSPDQQGPDHQGSGGEASIRGSHLLVAVGRRPNSDDLGLEQTGIQVDDRGFIRVNHRLETDVEGVWALGEIAGSAPFTHVAYDDYRVVAANVLGDGGGSRQGRLVPHTLFTDPQLGRVGMTEREAREAGHQIRVAKMPMSRVARAMEMDETRGFMKAVVEEGSGKILGAAILGVEGGEVAAVIQVAMMGGLGYTALRDGVFSHPTLAESLNNLFATLD